MLRYKHKKIKEINIAILGGCAKKPLTGSFHRQNGGLDELTRTIERRSQNRDEPIWLRAALRAVDPLIQYPQGETHVSFS
jgi:hypothetical protein